jgi:hypothetical protein
VDFDGTLTRGAQPERAVLNVIQRLRAEQMRVILVTGRILSELRHSFSEVDSHFDAIVAENGAVLSSSDESISGRDQALASPVPMVLEDALVRHGVPVRRGQVLLACDSVYDTVVLTEIHRLGLECQVMYNRASLMVLPAGVSKATGLSEALSMFSLSPHNVIAIGDAENDHALLTMCLAALGAAEILRIDPTHDPSLDLLADTADLIWSSYSPPDWPWPETRLTHLNAVIPEALILASGSLGRLRQRAEAMDLLRWLIDGESMGNRLSVTPIAGRSMGDPRPAFTQSPLEVACLAEACARAADSDEDPIWTQTILAAGAWFLGHNDQGEMMISTSSGGCFDGLQANGVDSNQGASASLAMISTLQRALKVTAVARR